MATTAVIYVGSSPGPQVAPRLAEPDLAIAADSGLSVATELGRRVDVIVGDLDSVDPDQLSSAERAGVPVERHDADKDATDLELAVSRALAIDPTRLVVIGGAGGRLDHLAANLAVLCSDDLRDVEVEGWLGPAHVTVVRHRRELAGRPGLLVSLLAWGGHATGVATEGLRWPLRDATLLAGSAWGTSNEFVGASAAVSVTSGVLTAIVPDMTSLHPVIDLT